MSNPFELEIKDDSTTSGDEAPPHASPITPPEELRALSEQWQVPTLRYVYNSPHEAPTQFDEIITEDSEDRSFPIPALPQTVDESDSFEEMPYSLGQLTPIAFGQVGMRNSLANAEHRQSLQLGKFLIQEQQEALVSLRRLTQMQLGTLDNHQIEALTEHQTFVESEPPTQPHDLYTELSEEEPSESLSPINSGDSYIAYLKSSPTPPTIGDPIFRPSIVDSPRVRRILRALPTDNDRQCIGEFILKYRHRLDETEREFTTLNDELFNIVNGILDHFSQLTLEEREKLDEKVKKCQSDWVETIGDINEHERQVSANAAPKAWDLSQIEAKAKFRESVWKLVQQYKTIYLDETRLSPDHMYTIDWAFDLFQENMMPFADATSAVHDLHRIQEETLGDTDVYPLECQYNYFEFGVKFPDGDKMLSLTFEEPEADG